MAFWLLSFARAPWSRWGRLDKAIENAALGELVFSRPSASLRYIVFSIIIPKLALLTIFGWIFVRLVFLGYYLSKTQDENPWAVLFLKWREIAVSSFSIYLLLSCRALTFRTFTTSHTTLGQDHARERSLLPKGRIYVQNKDFLWLLSCITFPRVIFITAMVWTCTATSRLLCPTKASMHLSEVIVVCLTCWFAYMRCVHGRRGLLQEHASHLLPERQASSFTWAIRDAFAVAAVGLVSSGIVAVISMVFRIAGLAQSWNLFNKQIRSDWRQHESPYSWLGEAGFVSLLCPPCGLAVLDVLNNEEAGLPHFVAVVLAVVAVVVLLDAQTAEFLRLPYALASSIKHNLPSIPPLRELSVTDQNILALLIKTQLLEYTPPETWRRTEAHAMVSDTEGLDAVFPAVAAIVPKDALRTIPERIVSHNVALFFAIADAGLCSILAALMLAEQLVRPNHSSSQETGEKSKDAMLLELEDRLVGSRMFFKAVCLLYYHTYCVLLAERAGDHVRDMDFAPLYQAVVAFAQLVRLLNKLPAAATCLTHEQLTRVAKLHLRASQSFRSTCRYLHPFAWALEEGVSGSQRQKTFSGNTFNRPFY